MGAIPGGGEWFDLQGTAVEQDHFHWQHRLDRLNVAWQPNETVELSFGRQAVSWGTTLFLTPADPFIPFSPADPFRVYRGGIDAARARIYPSPLSEIDVVVLLQRHAESAMQVARAQSEVGGETAHVYTDTRYAARTWDHERRVVIKAEVVRLGDREPRDNPRFVVTNLRQTLGWTPKWPLMVYCENAAIENSGSNVERSAGNWTFLLGMSNVLAKEKRQQVLALGRLGWSLRRIERATGVRRETVSSHLKPAGVVVRGRGRPPSPNRKTRPFLRRCPPTRRRHRRPARTRVTPRPCPGTAPAERRGRAPANPTES